MENISGSGQIISRSGAVLSGSASHGFPEKFAEIAAGAEAAGLADFQNTPGGSQEHFGRHGNAVVIQVICR